jgi:hypothetical protein
MPEEPRSRFLEMALHELGTIGADPLGLLTAQGVNTIADLLRLGCQGICATCRVDERTAVTWLAISTLCQIAGMTPALAAQCVASRLITIADIADAGLQTLERAAKRGDGVKVSLYKLAEIQRHAAALKDAGILLCRVLDSSQRQQVEGVEVRVAGQAGRTDAQGRCALAAIAAGRQIITLKPPGRIPVRLATTVRPGIPTREICVRVPTAALGKPMDLPPSPLVMLRKGLRASLVEVSLAAVASGTYLVVSPESTPSKLRLVSLSRRRVDDRVEGSVVVGVDPSLLPAAPTPRSVFQYLNGALIATGMSAHQAAAAEASRLLTVPLRERVRRIQAVAHIE